MKPPGVKAEWDENSSVQQAELLSYSQIRNLEEAEMASLMAGSRAAAGL
jgi:hypothetical protein